MSNEPISELTDRVTQLWALLRKTPWLGLVGWAPGPIAALLNRWFAPLRKLPILWSPEWGNWASSLDALGVWLSVLVVAVLYVVQRNLNKTEQARLAIVWLLISICLIAVCITFHTLFWNWNIQLPLYGILQSLWQLSYVALIVSAAVAITFGALYARKRS